MEQDTESALRSLRTWTQGCWLHRLSTPSYLGEVSGSTKVLECVRLGILKAALSFNQVKGRNKLRL